MNTRQLIKIMHEMHRDVTGMKRKPIEEDPVVQNFLIRLYNITDLDWEEIKNLWWEYLTKGSLSIPEAIKTAKRRLSLMAKQ